MKRNWKKFISSLLVLLFCFVTLAPFGVEARGHRGCPGWGAPPPPPRHHRDRGWSGGDTAALVVLGLGLWAISSHSNDSRLDAIYDQLCGLPSGDYYIEKQSEAGLYKNVLRKHPDLGTWYYDRSRFVVRIY